MFHPELMDYMQDNSLAEVFTSSARRTHLSPGHPRWHPTSGRLSSHVYVKYVEQDRSSRHLGGEWDCGKTATIAYSARVNKLP